MGAASDDPLDVSRFTSSVRDSRRWTRDIGALLALPAMWVDHDQGEIARGLLSVLFGVLELEGAYARFDDRSGADRPVELWRPSGETMPAEVRIALETRPPQTPGIITTSVIVPDVGGYQVTSLPLTLPWDTGLVVVSTNRPDFPSALEVYLLRVAVSQAVIAIHSARRLAREHDARSRAEAVLLRQNQVLHALIDDLEPALVSISSHLSEAIRVVAEVDSLTAARAEGAPDHARSGRVVAADAPVEQSVGLPSLTRREAEVLGLLAQGLSNKEIAAVMWLSDRTVERHVTSLYRKIGVVRRSAATAFALRHGVI